MKKPTKPHWKQNANETSFNWKCSNKIDLWINSYSLGYKLDFLHAQWICHHLKWNQHFSCIENRPGLVVCKFISKYNWMVFHGKDVSFECTFNLIQKSLCLLMDCVANIVEMWPTPHPNTLWLAPRFHAIPCNCRKITNHKNLNIFLLRKHLLPTHAALEMEKRDEKKAARNYLARISYAIYHCGNAFQMQYILWKCILSLARLIEMKDLFWCCCFFLPPFFFAFLLSGSV